MSIKRLLGINFLFVPFLILISLSLAKAEGINIGPITFNPAVSLNWSYDDNYLYNEMNKKGAYYLDVNPSLGISYGSRENKFSLGISSPIRYFSEAKAPDKKTKFQETFYTADASIKLPWRSYLRVHDSFTSTKLSPFLTEEKPPRPDSLENHAGFTFGTSLGGLLKFEGDYRNDLYKRKDRDNIRYSVNDRKVNNIRGTVTLTFLANDSILADYSYRTDKFKNDSARDLKSWQYDFGLLHKFKKFLSWSGRIGFSKTTGEGGIGKNIFSFNQPVPKRESDTFVWGQNFDFKITDKTSLNFSISKSVSKSVTKNVSSVKSKTPSSEDTTTGKSLSMFFDFNSSVTDRTDISLSGRRTVSDNTIFNDLSLDMNQKFFDRITLNLSGSYGLNEFKRGISSLSSNSKSTDKRWNESARLTFKIFKYTNTGISFRHEDRKSSFGNYSKNITSVNMQISF